MTCDHDLEIVRELHPPVAQLAGPAAAQARESARIALTAVIERGDSQRRPRRTVPRLGQRQLPPLGALGVAAALILAVVLILSLRGTAGNPTSAAAAVLQRAAHTAAAAGGPRQLRPGEYWYVKSYDTSAGATVAAPSVRGGIRVIVDALTTTERQVWIGIDRRGLDVRRVTRPITFLSAAARQQWIRYERPPQVSLKTRWPLPPDSFIRPYQQLQALPSNVDALLRMFERHAGNGSAAAKDAEMFTEIGDLLRYQPIPAKVRTALYLVAARIPGIQMLGLTHDAIGRPALAVALNDRFAGLRDELLFDPHTSALLGESTVVVHPPSTYHVKPGTVQTGSTYIISGVVDRIGQIPAR